MKRLIVSSLLLTLGTAAHSADGASPSSVEDRLKKLEQELQAVQKENLELRRELGVGSGATASFVKPGARSALEVRLGGYIQTQAEFGDTGDARWTGLSSNDRFYVRRARASIFGSFLEKFTYRMETDFAGALGQQSALRAQLTDGWVSYNPYDFLNVRVGQFFPTYGWEKRLSPMLEQSVELSLATDRFLPDRQLGIQVGGGVFEKRLGYYLGVFNGNNVNNNFNDDDNFQIVPRLEVNAWRGKMADRDSFINFGVNATFSDDTSIAVPSEWLVPGRTTFSGYRTGLAADAQIRLGPVDIWLEDMVLFLDPNNGDDFTAYGGYAQATYLITPKIQALAKYEYYDANNDESDDFTQTGTFGIAYLFKGDNLKVMLNYLLMDVAGEDDLENKVLLRLQAGF